MSETQKISAWAATLRGIGAFNILLWAVTCLPLAGGSTMLTWQVALSGVYVAVCAFRAFLPRVDLERYCLVDSPLSSMFLGRSAATVAEVCFAAQIALVLHQVGQVAGMPWIATASYFVVPPLVLAQGFCWYSVITLNHIGHAIEQSLWAGTMAAVGACLGSAATALDGAALHFVAAGVALSLVFVVFMVFVDVPMYVRRWRLSRREQRRYLSLREGLMDARHRRVATRDWSTWRSEVAWLTGYFSLAVWLSVSIVHFTVR